MARVAVCSMHTPSAAVLCFLSLVMASSHAHGRSLQHAATDGAEVVGSPFSPDTADADERGGVVMCSSMFMPSELNVASSEGSPGWAIESAAAELQRLINKEVALQEDDSEDVELTATLSAITYSTSDLAKSYTILVPPASDMQLLERASTLREGYEYEGGGSSVLGSLLLHVLLGRWTDDDLLMIGRANGTVDTIHGRTLQLSYDALADAVDGFVQGLSISYAHSTSSLHTAQRESCKTGSILLQTDTLLTEGLSMQQLGGFVGSASNESEPCTFLEDCGTSAAYPADVADSGTQGRQRDRHGEFLPLSVTVAACVVLLCGFYVFLRLRDRRRRVVADRETEATSASSRGVRAYAALHTASAVELAAILPSKKMHRVDALRWSTTPEATPANAITPSDTNTSPPHTAASCCIAKKDTVCVICYERQGDHVLLPCGHGGYCGACAHTLLSRKSLSRLCPICRARITAAVQVVMSTPVGQEGDAVKAILVTKSVEDGTKTVSS